MNLRMDLYGLKIFSGIEEGTRASGVLPVVECCCGLQLRQGVYVEIDTPTPLYFIAVFLPLHLSLESLGLK